MKSYARTPTGQGVESLPSRERGLKSPTSLEQTRIYAVAPLAGAWIEIAFLDLVLKRQGVAPLAGAWIEILLLEAARRRLQVAPLAGAWIEIFVRSS